MIDSAEYNIYIRVLINSLCSGSGCKGKAVDMIFLLDGSGSVTYTNFQKILKFAADVAGAFDISANQSRVGVLTFSNAANFQFHLNKYFDKAAVVNAIKSIKYPRGGTATAAALDLARTQGFVEKNGARPR